MNEITQIPEVSVSPWPVRNYPHHTHWDVSVTVEGEFAFYRHTERIAIGDEATFPDVLNYVIAQVRKRLAQKRVVEMQDAELIYQNTACEHGHQRRKCPICERDEEVAILRAENAKLRAEVESNQLGVNEIRDDCERRMAIRLEEIEKLRSDVHYLCKFNPRFADLMYDVKMRRVREAREGE